MSLKIAGTSIRCPVLVGNTMRGEIEVFKGKPVGRMAKYLSGMPTSMQYDTQEMEWVDQRVF